MRQTECICHGFERNQPIQPTGPTAETDRASVWAVEQPGRIVPAGCQGHQMMFAIIKTVVRIIEINGGKLRSRDGRDLMKSRAQLALMDILFGRAILMAGLGFLDDFFHGNQRKLASHRTPAADAVRLDDHVGIDQYPVPSSQRHTLDYKSNGTGLS